MVTLLAFLSQCIFGFSFLFSSIALEYTTPLVLLGFRFAAAFLIMNVLRLTGKFPVDLKGKDFKPLLLLGLLQPVIYFLCENYGMVYSNSSFTGIMIAVIPIVGVIFGACFLKEYPTKLQTACTVLAIFGVILTNLGKKEGSVQTIGILLLMLAVITAACFTILSRRIASQYTAMERTYVMFALGTVVFVPLALIQGSRDWEKYILLPCRQPSFWAAILYLSAFSSVAAYMLMNYALTYLSIAKSVIFACMATVISIFAGVLILHEPFTALQAVGSVIIILGVAGVSL
jgi:drug/metabolite transporter (DMT)-like permease